jgi:CBS domain-containing membrane protein
MKKQEKPNTPPAADKREPGRATTQVQGLRAFVPAPIAIDGRERMRAIIGGFAGILLAAMVSHVLLGSAYIGAWLLAPLGASAVLVFAAPASPLAQPWAVVGGNTISALVGSACALAIPDPTLAAAAAVGLAITAMLLCRCLHPPGGAMALSAVLMHAAHGQLPVGVALLNSVLLVSAGVAYNSFTGRRYPHIQVQQAAVGTGTGARFISADLDAVVARYNQVLDVSRDDLEALLVGAELEGYRRRMGEIRCKDLMSREVIAVEFGSTLQEAWNLMHKHRIKALPVIDRARRVIGIVTLVDFMRGTAFERNSSFAASLRHFILPDGLSHSEKPEVVGQIMTHHADVLREDRHAVELMPIFTETRHHHIPIVDHENRIVGIVTQSDFLRFLNQKHYLSFDQGLAAAAA